MQVINGGIGRGYIHNLNNEKFNYQEKTFDSIKEEKLFLKGINNYKNNLMLLQQRTNGNSKRIIETYIAFLNDEIVNNEVILRIKDNNESAGFAYNQVIDKYVGLLKKAADKYLKERANDFLDLKEKVLNEIYQKHDVLAFDKPTILVVDNLNSSLVFNLPKEVKGIIAKKGGELSHAAILMKEKKIPYVVKDSSFENDLVITLDANNKTIIKEEAYYAEDKEELNLKLTNINDEINLYLNLSSIADLNNKYKNIYKGIGLVRSEHLFALELTYPILEKQIDYYKEILVGFYNKEVTIRLFDLKKDKGSHFFIADDVDEFKFNGEFSELYKEQLKALVLANEPYGNLKITIPMIRSINEYIEVKNYLQSLKKELNLIRPTPGLGIMVETKEALKDLMMYDAVSFIGIGTNDLMKELYNISRGSELNSQRYLNYIYQDLKIIKEFSHKYAIPYLYCGDLVSTEVGLQKLLDNGEKSFSIAGGFLEAAVKVINNYKNKKA